jgi:hypothetical protein
MNKQNLNINEEEWSKKWKLREKKKKVKMKISGGNVKKLSRIIISKSKKI